MHLFLGKVLRKTYNVSHSKLYKEPADASQAETSTQESPLKEKKERRSEDKNGGEDQSSGEGGSAKEDQGEEDDDMNKGVFSESDKSEDDRKEAEEDVSPPKAKRAKHGLRS